LGWEHEHWLYSGIKNKYISEWEQFPDRDLIEKMGFFDFEVTLRTYASKLFKKKPFKNNFTLLYSHCIDNFVKDTNHFLDTGLINS